MQRIYIIRHGETDWNRQFRFQGQQDVPLNERGRRQAIQLSEYLAGKNIKAVYSSPLLRARETAQQIALKYGIEPIFDNRFSEIDFGNWEGSSYTELTVEQRLEAERWFKNPEEVLVPGGEHFALFKKRVLDGYNGILHENINNNMVIVSHGGVIRVILSSILDIPAIAFTKLKLYPASLTVVLYDDWGNGYLELFNSVCHSWK